MPLARKARFYHVTADSPDHLAGDEVLGNCGQGTYRIWIKATGGTADSSFTVRDGSSTVINAWPIPSSTAGTTYPVVDRSSDIYFDVRYVGRGATLPIDILDGTNQEISLYIEYLG